jgi:hypothetical protein
MSLALSKAFLRPMNCVGRRSLSKDIFFKINLLFFKKDILNFADYFISDFV